MNFKKETMMNNQNWLAFMVPLVIGATIWWASVQPLVSYSV